MLTDAGDVGAVVIAACCTAVTDITVKVCVTVVTVAHIVAVSVVVGSIITQIEKFLKLHILSTRSLFSPLNTTYTTEFF